jgi:hypothetical protein
VKKPDTILDEIHAIRRLIDEKTNSMTHAEINAYYQASGERVAKQYGFKLIGVDEERDFSRDTPGVQ